MGTNFLVNQREIGLTIDFRRKISLLVGDDVVNEPINIFLGPQQRLGVMNRPLNVAFALNFELVTLQFD